MTPSETITVRVNGNAHDVALGTTVADLVTELGITGGAVAVEVNRSIVPKADHGAHALAGGDEVEVVTIVGGG